MGLKDGIKELLVRHSMIECPVGRESCGEDCEECYIEEILKLIDRKDGKKNG